MAGEHFLAFEVAAIGNHRQRLRPHCRPRLLGHRTQLIAVDAIAGDLVRHDQVMLRLNRCLDVVTDHASAATHHRTCVGISKRNLFVRGGLQLSLNIPELLHLGFQGGNLAVQTLGFSPRHGSFCRSAVSSAVR